MTHISFAVEPIKPSTKTQNHLEELFLWKISEELKLSVKEEKKLTDITHDLNKKKQILAEQLQNALKSLQTAKDKPDKELFKLRQLFKEQGELAIKEFDEIRKALGAPKAAQYWVVKNELTSKVKSLILTPEKEPKTENHRD